MTNGSLMKVESIVECSPCNTFDLYLAKFGIENQILVFFRVTVLHRYIQSSAIEEHTYFEISYNKNN